VRQLAGRGKHGMPGFSGKGSGFDRVDQKVSRVLTP
jgi:hypothetical protein